MHTEDVSVINFNFLLIRQNTIPFNRIWQNFVGWLIHDRRDGYSYKWIQGKFAQTKY